MTRAESGKPSHFPVELTFHDDLPFFLKSKKSRIERLLTERTSVKDVIEACGVPHTEVYAILIDGRPEGFGLVLDRPCKIEVYGVSDNPTTLLQEKHLQVRAIRTFVADGHLGKLVRDLRLLGIDVVYDRDAQDRQLIATTLREERALLTRDRRLLMHAALRHGCYLRSQNPIDQTLEVVRRFHLSADLNPFSRCLRCNAPLHRVTKEQIFEKLEPLTKIHYHEFRNCSGCEQVYWSGSHFEKLQTRIELIRTRLEKES